MPAKVVDASAIAAVLFGEPEGPEEAEVPVPEAFLMADRENPTVYDACYLWLSLKLGVELVTLDRDLKKAAEAAPGSPAG